jgi:hypothetical protein
MNNPHIDNWVSDTVRNLAVPLSEVCERDKYILHYYKGFDCSLAVTICEDMFSSLTLSNKVDIYLYIIDYPHEHKRMDCIGSNNGYMKMVGSYYSIVIFRKLFWPKTLIHEILHISWIQNGIPRNVGRPAWDEAIIEAQAVRLSICKNYIDVNEYRCYINNSKNTIVNNITNVSGGRLQSFITQQKTNLLEYIFLSDEINNVINN